MTGRRQRWTTGGGAVVLAVAVGLVLASGPGLAASGPLGDATTPPLITDPGAVDQAADDAADTPRGAWADTPHTSAFEILELAPASIELDEPRNVTVRVRLVNNEDRSTVEQVDLRMNGTTVTSRVIDLDSGEQRDVELRVPASELETGTYYVFSIWTDTDAATGTVRVADGTSPTATETPETPDPSTPTATQATETPTATQTPAADGAGPGFGLVGAAGALLLIVVASRQRS